MKAPPCRLCGSGPVQRLGAIPDSDFFAGRVLPAALPGGHLWRCQGCGSMFRHPVLAPATYLELYAAGVAEAWTAEGGRLDLPLIRALIARRPGAGRILDVGCGSGGFLASLPARLQKFAVEPSSAAARRAAQQGVTVLGGTLAELAPEALFDIVTIIDVIEHVVDVGGLLEAILPHLAPGGCLILSTGDPGHALWLAVFGARFWYSSYPEHISFPSAAFLASWQSRRGLQPPQIVRTRYRHLSLPHRVAILATQLLFWMSPGALNALGRALQWLRRAPRPRARHFPGGGPGLFRDHQVVMIAREGVIRSPVS